MSRSDEAAIWHVTADGDPATVHSRGVARHPLTRPVRAVHVCLADALTELEVVRPSDPILFFAEDGRRLPAWLPLPPDRLWILHPADRELIVAGEFRAITEVPFRWVGWRLRLASLEQVSSLLLEGGPAHAVRADPRPRLLPGVPLPGVTTPDGSPVYPELPRLSLPDGARWHVGIRPAAGGVGLVSREFAPAGAADIWDGVPQPIRGAFDIAVRGPLGRSLRQTIVIADPAPVDSGPAPVDSAPAPAPAAVPPLPPRAAAIPPPPSRAVIPPLPLAPQVPLASAAELSSGLLTFRDCARVDGLAAALYLARAPWRPPVVVPVPDDGAVKLPPEVREAGPLRVLLRVDDTTWPGWPGRDAFTCAAPGNPASADLEEEALSRFLAGARDLPVRPRRVDRLWRLIQVAGDLIALGAPADLRERCSAVLREQPRQAMTGLLDGGLDGGLDGAACVTGLISTGLAAARPVMLDDMRSAERLWEIVPPAAAILSSRLLAGPAYPDEDPAAVVVEAALARCGPALAAVLRGDDDPHAEVLAANPPEAPRPAPAVVPQALLDPGSRAAAASQLFGALGTPELTRAAQEAASVIRSAARLVADSPYHRAAAQITARRLALPAMSLSLALVARIAARGHEPCRSFERTWRPRWTDLARQAPDLTSIDLVLAEAHIAAAERTRFA